MLSGFAFTAQKISSSRQDDKINQTPLSATYSSVLGQVNVDVVHRQPIMTIGWHYANLLHGYST